MSPIFSIIIPVYNSEVQITRLLDAILGQQCEEIELILVDDGSTDSSAEICNQYASRDHRITVIHQKNRGPSSARNAGLRTACGKYIIFADSDDFILPGALATLARAMEDDCDLLVHGHLAETETGTTETIRPSPCYYKGRLIQAALSLAFPGIVPASGEEPKISGNLWDKVYRLDLIRANDLIFDENIRKAEDVIFNISYLTHCRNVKVISDCTYHYCYTQNSIMRSYVPPREIGVDKSVYIISRMDEEIKKGGDTPQNYDSWLSSRLIRIVIDSSEQAVRNLPDSSEQRSAIRNLADWLPVYLQKYGMEISSVHGLKFKFESWMVRNKTVPLLRIYAQMMARHHE